ncbi:MAG: DegT/DnrJ/EryC1/StrS family aminotransferase [Pirellulales bacterium]
MRRIPIAGPSITEKEIAYVADAAANGWYERASEYQERFERAFAQYIGSRFAVTLPSCTSAIHLSLLALGVGPGDEVIVPDVTWIATSAPIRYVGAEPVMVDIDPRSWCLSVSAFRRSISDKTRAVIAVDLYGGMPRLDAIRRIADARGVVVIEDAAEAFGSELHGVKAGRFGDTGVFSFHGSKTMTTGEGGMLVTDRPDIHQRVLFLRDHGRSPGDVRFQNEEVAYKYRMSNLQAAFGLAQVERADQLVAKKREIFSWYRDALRDVPAVTLNEEPPGVRNSYWMVTAVLDEQLQLDKQQVIDQLDRREIDARPFFHPLSSLPAYAGTAAARRARRTNRTAYHISPRGVHLPCGMNLRRDQAETVAGALREIIAKAERSRTNRKPRVA